MTINFVAGLKHGLPSTRKPGERGATLHPYSLSASEANRIPRLIPDYGAINVLIKHPYNGVGITTS
jgi:hypothetical protein